MPSITSQFGAAGVAALALALVSSSGCGARIAHLSPPLSGPSYYTNTQAGSFTVNGTIEPPGRAVVWLYGVTTSFSISTQSGNDGHFRFSGVRQGTYTLNVVTTNRGEWHQTIDVSPGTADAKARIWVEVRIDTARSLAEHIDIVSARELSIPQSALKEYGKAERSLSKHDADGAVAHLERATEFAPQFTAAWNTLGTIAYHAGNYSLAERYFRKGLAADPAEYAPLVNLGGVLINLGKYQDAWSYNKLAVSKQPNDALAHAQLGMACFALGKLEAAETELREAIRLDPRHFSNPQLLLADIYDREHKLEAEADILEQFLTMHPSFAGAGEIRERIAKLR